MLPKSKAPTLKSVTPAAHHLQASLSVLQVPTQLVPLMFTALAAWDRLAETLSQIMPAGKFCAVHVMRHIPCRLLSPAAPIWTPPIMPAHDLPLCEASALLLLWSSSPPALYA